MVISTPRAPQTQNKATRDRPGPTGSAQFHKNQNTRKVGTLPESFKLTVNFLIVCSFFMFHVASGARHGKVRWSALYPSKDERTSLIGAFFREECAGGQAVTFQTYIPRPLSPATSGGGCPVGRDVERVLFGVVGGRTTLPRRKQRPLKMCHLHGADHTF